MNTQRPGSLMLVLMAALLTALLTLTACGQPEQTASDQAVTAQTPLTRPAAADAARGR
jgi:ABC-type glycerol-3-phosphate transport system substrate-binding protein